MKEQSANLKDKLSQIANKQNIENTGSLLGNDIISDHLAFTAPYLPAIMVSQEYMDVIHTPEDSTDKVDGTPVKQAVCRVGEDRDEGGNSQGSPTQLPPKGYGSWMFQTKTLITLLKRIQPHI